MRKAFTLSEVLITLSIVGVIAVLTIPPVMKNYRNRLYVAQLQKVSAQIENAMQQMMNDEHVDNFLETKVLSPNVNEDEENPMSGVEYFFTNYFKTAKVNCTVGTDKNSCFASSYSTINGNKTMTGGQSVLCSGNTVNDGFCVQTTNGAAIKWSYNSSNRIPTLVIDVNGISEPNVIGRDLFLVDIRDGNRLVDPTPAEQCNVKTSGWSQGNVDRVNAYAAGCYNRVVDDGWKMEY